MGSGKQRSKKGCASDPASKIDLADAPDVVAKKINKAHCPEGEIEGNGVLAFMKYVVMTHLHDQGKTLLIERPEKFGGSIEYSTYEQLEKDFVHKKLHPMDLKSALARELNSIIEPCRKRLTPELIERAYPSE